MVIAAEHGRALLGGPAMQVLVQGIAGALAGLVGGALLNAGAALGLIAQCAPGAGVFVLEQRLRLEPFQSLGGKLGVEDVGLLECAALLCRGVCLRGEPVGFNLHLLLVLLALAALGLGLLLRGPQALAVGAFVGDRLF
jgi:hypothetical protein